LENLEEKTVRGSNWRPSSVAVKLNYKKYWNESEREQVETTLRGQIQDMEWEGKS
jgi:hypothetical protein